MRRVYLSALERHTSQIGFGCGTLTGRTTLREARALIETALDLGIRYFDTAPAYGMGTSEEVLGEVVGNHPEVIIATKAGLPRPLYSSHTNLARKLLKPLLDRSRTLKTFARRLYAPRGNSAPAGKKTCFQRDFILRSVDESLRALRRDRLDILLAHDPELPELTEQLAAEFADMRDSGLCRAFGAAVAFPGDAPSCFGSVWQSAWPQGIPAIPRKTLSYCFHGIIRNAQKTSSGVTFEPASTLVRTACDRRPDAVILVATSSPVRLRQLLSHLTP
jgi:aryl-alcohol dehydrogenase-like predicted oxidoreductase